MNFNTRISIILISGAIVSSCIQTSQDTVETNNSVSSNTVTLSKNEIKNTLIVTDSIRQTSINSKILVRGKIEVPPQNIISISVPFGGYLKYTHLLPGMQIKKGEVIAIMEHPDYIKLQEEFLSTKIRLNQLEKEYYRQKDLLMQKGISEKSFEQLSAEYEVEKVKLKSLYEQLKMLNINPDDLSYASISREIRIYSPINGYVTKVNANIGKYFQPTDVLFELVNPDDIHLLIQVFEKDVQQLSIHQDVVAYPIFYPQKKYLCKVVYINKEVNTDKTVDVHCHFNEYDASLLPGYYMQAEILIRRGLKYVLPSEAVIFYNNQHYVFVNTSNNVYELTPIEIESSDENNTIVKNGERLRNKKIVIKGNHALLMKLKNVEE